MFLSTLNSLYPKYLMCDLDTQQSLHITYSIPYTLKPLYRTTVLGIKPLQRSKNTIAFIQLPLYPTKQDWLTNVCIQLPLYPKSLSLSLRTLYLLYPIVAIPFFLHSIFAVPFVYNNLYLLYPIFSLPHNQELPPALYNSPKIH